MRDMQDAECAKRQGSIAAYECSTTGDIIMCRRVFGPPFVGSSHLCFLVLLMFTAVTVCHIFKNSVSGLKNQGYKC